MAFLKKAELKGVSLSLLISWNDFKIYLFALFKAFIPKKKINNLDELENFIQTKSAWVSQVTLYSYLKTRMGTRYVLHFENDMDSLSLINDKDAKIEDLKKNIPIMKDVQMGIPVDKFSKFRFSHLRQ